ncbi:MAG TPA: PAS domain-containing protein [Noviherbaspirillum sp.]
MANTRTDGQRMEADLTRAEEWLQLSQAYARFGIWDWDMRSGVTHLSEQIAPLFGYREETLRTTREHFLNVVHPRDRQRVADAISACAGCDARDDGRDGFDIEYRIVRADGEVRWMRERGGVERDADGAPIRVLGVVQDVTDQKQSERALRESEEQFRLFAENIREMIWIVSPRMDKLFYVSHACTEILGVEREHLYTGMLNWENMIYREDLPLVKAALARQAQGEPAEVETRIVRPDGKVRWIRVRSLPFKNGSGERMTSGIAEDITDRKQTEKERIAQMTLQRTTLIREVHHRIKNNLQGVAGLLRQHADAHPQVSPIIDRAIAQVQTVAVVHGLQGKTMDNEIVLCEMVPMIARTVKSVLPSRPAIEVYVDVPQRIRVSEQESVSLALVLNELIMNSAKHANAAASEARIVITVRWDQKQSLARIGIVNPGTLPAGFGFLAGTGTGTGLELVRSLLPPEGSTLSFASGNGHVEAVLELSPPSIYNL